MYEFSLHNLILYYAQSMKYLFLPNLQHDFSTLVDINFFSILNNNEENKFKKILTPNSIKVQGIFLEKLKNSILETHWPSCIMYTVLHKYLNKTILSNIKV